MRGLVFFGLAITLTASGAYAGVTINGTTISFNDATVQSTAKPADHGGSDNSLGGMNSFIGGGNDNTVSDDFGVVNGGSDNVAGDDDGNVSTWRFKNEDDSVRHIGPVAQDFMAAFGYGKSDKHITATDADGVVLAAIQGLNAKVDDQAETITALRWHNAHLEARLARIEEAILHERQPVPTQTY